MFVCLSVGLIFGTTKYSHGGERRQGRGGGVYRIVIKVRIVGCNFKIGFLKEFARTFKEGIFGDIILNNIY